MGKKSAIIDLGSYGIRMSVYEQTGNGFMVLRNETRSVKLSEGIYENDGVLQKKPMKRTIDAFKEFSAIAKENGVKAEDIDAITTSAVREAPNRDEFINQVKDTSGITLRIIEGVDEAKYGGELTAQHTLKTPKEKSVISVDIGGGSTEFSIMKNGEVLDRMSLKIGTNRLKELYFDKNDKEGAREYIKELMQQLPDSAYADNDVTIVATGGAGNGIAKALMEKNSYPLKEKPHGFKYSTSEEENYFETALEKTKSELNALNVPSKHHDASRYGTFALGEIIKNLKASEVINSVSNIPDGIYLESLAQDLEKKGVSMQEVNLSIETIKDLYLKEEKKEQYAQNVSSENDLINNSDISDKKKEVLKAVSSISNIDDFIESFEDEEIMHANLLSLLNYKLSHEEIVLISEILRYQKFGKINQKIYAKYEQMLPTQEEIRELAQITERKNRPSKKSAIKKSHGAAVSI